MLLGAGDLGAELVAGFAALGAYVIAVDTRADAPAQRIADESAVAELTDSAVLGALIATHRPDHIVTATDAVAADALADAAADQIAVVPGARSARLSLDREGLRRLAADELGLPTAPFWFAGSVAELSALTEHVGFPLVVKPLVALPGDWQSVLLRPDDVEPAWERAIAAAGPLGGDRVLVETVIEIDYEITMLTVHSGEHELHFCEPIGHRQTDGSGQPVLEAWQPQPMSRVAVDSAHSIAARIVTALGGRGVFGVELLIRGDEVYFSDVTSYPHDVGLVTLRSQRLSIFDLYARAALGLPVDGIMVSPAAAEVVYTDTDVSGAGGPLSALTAALQVPESDIRVFAGTAGRTGAPARHRLGVALASAPDVTTARDRVSQVSRALRNWWQHA